MVARSDSCLHALPPDALAAVGLADPADPVVDVTFTLSARGISLSSHGLSVSPEVIRDWMMEIPGEIRELAYGYPLHFRLTANGRTLVNPEDGETVTDRRLTLFANSFFEQMEAWRGMLREIVAQLPSYAELRADTEAYILARIRLALEQEPGSLDGAYWLSQMLCEDHYAPIPDPDDRARFAYRTGEYSPLFTALSGSHRCHVFSVPVTSKGSCLEEPSEAVRLRNVLFGKCLDQIIRELVPKAYAELVPGRMPAPDITPDITLVEVADAIAIVVRPRARPDRPGGKPE